MRAPLLLLALTGCIAPVQWSGPVREPPRYAYAGPHGVPLAFGGGVCPLETPHLHRYPPVPRDAFEETDTGFADTRKLHPFFDPHPLNGRTCFREGLHLHLEDPDEPLVWDEALGAWRARSTLPSPP